MTPILLLILFLESILIGIFLYIDILPYLKKKFFSKRYCNPNLDNATYIKLITNQALKQAISDATQMIRSDNTSFIFLFSIMIDNIRTGRYKTGWYFHFPKAFLFYGLIKIHEKRVEYKIIEDLFQKKFVNTYNEKKYKIDGIERTSIALVALYLYKKNNDSKYLNLINDTYSLIKKSTKKNGLVYYFNKGEHTDILYVDGLGMYIPFLKLYNEVFNNSEALDIAKTNLDFYIVNGTHNHLPFHNINGTIGLGPNNWGRGIGWYIIGLLFMIDVDKKYAKEANDLLDVLLSFQRNSFEWAQFIGTGKNYDASATLPILLLLQKLKPQFFTSNKQEIFDSLKSRTLLTGAIDFTSGDTGGINRYCDNLGESEFSQGLLLWLSSNCPIN